MEPARALSVSLLFTMMVIVPTSAVVSWWLTQLRPERWLRTVPLTKTPWVQRWLPALARDARELETRGFAEVGAVRCYEGLFRRRARVFFRDRDATWVLLGVVFGRSHWDVFTELPGGGILRTAGEHAEWRGAGALEVQSCRAAGVACLVAHEERLQVLAGGAPLGGAGTLEDYVSLMARVTRLRGGKHPPGDVGEALERAPASLSPDVDLHEVRVALPLVPHTWVLRGLAVALIWLVLPLAAIWSPGWLGVGLFGFLGLEGLGELVGRIPPVRVRVTTDVVEVRASRWGPWGRSVDVPLARIASVSTGPLGLALEVDDGPSMVLRGFGSAAENRWLAQALEAAIEQRLLAPVSAERPVPAELVALTEER